MVLTAYDIALIAGGFTVVGALLGTFITYRFALRLGSLAARREAGRKLREAFAPEMAALEKASRVEDRDIPGILKTAWPKHCAAVIEMQFHLPQHEKEALERAWREYWEVGGSIRFFDYYMGEAPREKFKERVHAILKYSQI